MKKRILFVDDEVNVLQGLKRMLRAHRDEWDVYFTDSGKSALEMMEQDRYDAIVTDMRMPGMDGAELLEKVKQRHPEMVRYVLSGYSDKEMVMRSVGASHQYLSKPCDPDKLKTLLTNTFALHRLLASDTLRTLVSGMTTLPSMPDIYQVIVEALQSDNASIAEIGNMIEKDVGMTVKVLQLVNSSYFGLGRKITSPAEAANFLGLDVLKGLVLANGIFSQFDETIVKKMSLQMHGSHSLAVAIAAKNIARAEGAPAVMVDQAYLGGLLHDMGTLVLASNVPDDYLQCLQLVKERNISMVDAEKEVFGTTHAEVGAYMLGLWGIDEIVVSAVAYHHNPYDFPCMQFSAVTAVYAACTFMHEYTRQDSDAAFSGSDLAHIESIGLAERLPVWQTICKLPEDEAA